MSVYDVIYNTFIEEIIEKKLYYTNGTKKDIIDAIYYDLNSIITDIINECKTTIILIDECDNPYVIENAYVSRDGKIYFSLKHDGNDIFCDAEEYLDVHPYELEEYISERIKEYFYDSNVIDMFLEDYEIYDKLENMTEDEIQNYFRTHSEEIFNEFKKYLLNIVREQLLNYIDENELVPGLEVMTRDKFEECVMKIDFSKWF